MNRLATKQSECCGRNCRGCSRHSYTAMIPLPGDDAPSKWCDECAATVYVDANGECPSCEVRL